jgi:hypothetical protein
MILVLVREKDYPALLMVAASAATINKAGL